jgi:hypothetical protein
MTKEQLWYVTNVYPEKVSEAEAKKEYDNPKYAGTPGMAGLDTYWEAVKKIIDKYYQEDIT